MAAGGSPLIITDFMTPNRRSKLRPRSIRCHFMQAEEGSAGKVKGQTFREFRRNETESILAKIKYGFQSPNFAISAGDKVVGRR